jgi:hypothetical protein
MLSSHLSVTCSPIIWSSQYSSSLTSARFIKWKRWTSLHTFLLLGFDYRKRSVCHPTDNRGGGVVWIWEVDIREFSARPPQRKTWGRCGSWNFWVERTSFVNIRRHSRAQGTRSGQHRKLNISGFWLLLVLHKSRRWWDLGSGRDRGGYILCLSGKKSFSALVKHIHTQCPAGKSVPGCTHIAKSLSLSNNCHEPRMIHFSAPICFDYGMHARKVFCWITE